MDEANGYIDGLNLVADNRLASLVAEQTDNTLRQRLVSVVGALAAIASAAAAVITIMRYAGELARARDLLKSGNRPVNQQRCGNPSYRWPRGGVLRGGMQLHTPLGASIAAG